MKASLTELFLLGAFGYAVYAWAYKGQSSEETTHDLTRVSTAVVGAIAKAPEAIYDTARKIPAYQAWSDEWIEEKLNRNSNRPS